MSDTDTIEAARSNHLEVLRDVIDLNARITRATGIIIEPRKPEAVDMTEACNQSAEDAEKLGHLALELHASIYPR